LTRWEKASAFPKRFEREGFPFQRECGTGSAFQRGCGFPFQKDFEKEKGFPFQRGCGTETKRGFPFRRG